MQYEALTADLERALLRALALRYAEVNEDRFRDRLRRPLLQFTDVASCLGRWISATRTIELARHFIATRPWLEITSVLEHEMAHQFVDEVLGIRDETAHGETFRRICAERGIDGRAGGAPIPSTDAAADTAGARTLDRIRKLLALAASSNQHEAEIAMRRAHELMLRHNIEHVAARESAGYEVRHLGDPLRRTNRVETEVMLLLGDYFFVKVIRVPVYVPTAGKTGNVFEIAGTRTSRWPSTSITSCCRRPTACGPRTAATRACATAAIALPTRPASFAASATSSVPSARSCAAPDSSGSATARSSSSIARATRGSPRAARTYATAAHTRPVVKRVVPSCCTSRCRRRAAAAARASCAASVLGFGACSDGSQSHGATEI